MQSEKNNRSLFFISFSPLKCAILRTRECTRFNRIQGFKNTQLQKTQLFCFLHNFLLSLDQFPRLLYHYHSFRQKTRCKRAEYYQGNTEFAQNMTKVI